MELVANQLQCSKGGRLLFRNLSFRVVAGQLCCIQGDNGSGKSTLLRILAGFGHFDKGQIQFNDTPVQQQWATYRAQIGYLGHKPGIHGALSPLENLALSAALAEKSWDPQQGKAILDALSLLPFAKLPCSCLSQGQQRKVALSMLILKAPPLWILDEPFTALDKQSVAVFHHYISDHRAQSGLVICATHSQASLLNPDHQVML